MNAGAGLSLSPETADINLLRFEPDKDINAQRENTQTQSGILLRSTLVSV